MEKRWKFNKKYEKGIIKSVEKRAMTVKATMGMLHKQLNPDDNRSVIPLGHGDPSPFKFFHPPVTAVNAIVDALRSTHFNGYRYPTDFPSAKKAVAEYISRDLPYRLSESDVCITVGCNQAILATISSLSSPPGSNILLPMPTYSTYDACSAVSGVEVRHYNLLPQKEWEVDLHSVEALADDNTVAIVIINPGNPCGSVYTHQHLENVAKMAEKLGLLVIADEVYEHMTFGDTPFVRMGTFALKAPVLTIGSVSKRWLVPGWRVGWLVTTDPNGILQNSEVKLDVSLLDDIEDDTDFCLKIAKEEKVVILPGSTLGMKNCLRITFALEPLVL